MQGACAWPSAKTLEAQLGKLWGSGSKAFLDVSALCDEEPSSNRNRGGGGKLPVPNLQSVFVLVSNILQFLYLWAFYFFMAFQRKIKIRNGKIHKKLPRDLTREELQSFGTFQTQPPVLLLGFLLCIEHQETPLRFKLLCLMGGNGEKRCK